MEPLSNTICRGCRLHMKQSIQARTFTSTTKLLAITPESPRYIDVPQPFQEDWAPPRFVSGRMPVPRELFPASRRDKPSPQYLANVTPESKKPIDYSKLSEKGQYRHRLSQMRKDYLRDGLTQLHKRKQNAIQRMQFRADEKQAERARLLSQAEREDARLTNISIPSEMLPDRIIDLHSLEAFKIHESKSANVARTEINRADLRKDQLHTLYMNSRSFITTEEQLKKKIEEEFADNKFGSNNINYWDKEIVPDSMAEMVNKSTTSPRMRPTGSTERQYQAAHERDQERMKRIAEKLSGGKI